MYMREMGSVELLTREGEIEIAKRIEDGLKHMVMAVSACPTTIAEILEHGDRIAERPRSPIDEVVDGLVDPTAKDFLSSSAGAGEDEDEEGEETTDLGASGHDCRRSSSELKVARAGEIRDRVAKLFDRMRVARSRRKATSRPAT
jgi:RNA polymerase primary sigma factor